LAQERLVRLYLPVEQPSPRDRSKFGPGGKIVTTVTDGIAATVSGMVTDNLSYTYMWRVAPLRVLEVPCRH
jgi:hypothetical protein